MGPAKVSVRKMVDAAIDGQHPVLRGKALEKDKGVVEVKESIVLD